MKKCQDLFESLSPCIDTDNDKVYENTLNWALKHEDIRNIALTGAYGSGKSSILKKYIKQYKNHNFIQISLANFKGENEEGITPVEQLQIEKSILQQLFYKENAHKFPYSRLSRIRSFSLISNLIISVVLFLFIFSLTIVLDLKFRLDSNELNILNTVSQNKETVFTISLIIFLICLIIVIYMLVYFIRSKLNISKVNLKLLEIKIDDKRSDSLFNEWFDEILYFFEKSVYKTVVFEDFDRFSNIEIFSKLRELNQLINNSAQVKPKIVFIYALKDTMFNNKDRTKFFDFIIPVIPIINSQNSEGILLEKIKQMSEIDLIKGLDLSNFEDKENKAFINTIKNISYFIDDMRVLKNIINETMIFAKVLSSDEEKFLKLFALIVYKNIHPKDYSDMQLNHGKIKLIINKKNKFNEEEEKSKREKIRQNEVTIESIRNEHLLNFTELRNLYIFSRIGDFNSVNFVLGCQIKGKKFNLGDLANEINFSEFKKIGSCSVILNSAWTKWTYEEFGNTIIDGISYTQREERLEAKLNSKIQYIQNENEIIRNQLREIAITPLKDIVAIQPKFFESDFADTEGLLKYFITEGLIDEQYLYYINYFYEGSLSRADLDFIMSLSKGYFVNNFDADIVNCDKIVDQLTLNHYTNQNILNYDLVNYLDEHEELYAFQLGKIAELIINERSGKINFDFIEGYFKKFSYKGSLINYLIKAYPKLWDYMENAKMLSDLELNNYSRLILEYCSEDALISIKEYPSFVLYLNRSSLTLENLNTLNENRITIILEVLDLKIRLFNIHEPKDYLLENIISKNSYEINIDMLLGVIGYYNNDQITEKNLLYLALEENNNDKAFIYINDNINQYIENVLLKITDIDENSYVMIMNHKNINDLCREKMLKQISIQIVDINVINELSVKEQIFIYKRVKMNWVNVFSYYDLIRTLDSVLISILNSAGNYDLERFRDLVLDEFEEEKIREFVFNTINCKSIEEESLVLLIEDYSINNTEYDFKKIEKDRLKLIIYCGNIEYTQQNFDVLNSIDTQLASDLVINQSLSVDNWYEDLEIPTGVFNLLLSEVKKEGISNLVDAYLLQHRTLDELSNESKKVVADEIINNTSLEFEISDKVIIYEILELNIESIKKIKLLVKSNNLIENDEFVTMIKRIGDNYSDIFDTHRRAKLVNDKAHKDLLTILKERSLIKSYRVEIGKERHYLRSYPR